MVWHDCPAELSATAPAKEFLSQEIAPEIRNSISIEQVARLNEISLSVLNGLIMYGLTNMYFFDCNEQELEREREKRNGGCGRLRTSERECYKY